MKTLKSWLITVGTILSALFFGYAWFTKNEREALKKAKEQRDEAIKQGDRLAEAKAEGAVARIRLAASERSKQPMRERTNAALAEARAAKRRAGITD